MKRVRFLSLLVLGLSVFGSWYGFNQYTYGAFDWWMVGGLVCGLFTISATLIAFLSIFALEPEPDGTFVIKRNSLYGKAFLWWSKLEDANDFGFCRTFWQTNFMLIITGTILGGFVFIGVILWLAIVEAGPLMVLFAFVYFIAAVVALALLCYGVDRLWVKARKKFSAVDTFSDVVTSGTSRTIIVVVFILGFFALLSWGHSMHEIFTFLWKSALFIAMAAVVITAFVSVVKLAFKIYKPLSQTQFGISFGSIYHQYLCPRIKIE